MQMLAEFTFYQQIFVEHLYCVTKTVLGVKRYTFALSDFTVCYGPWPRDTVLKTTTSGKKRQELETNINLSSLSVIF